MVGQLEGFIQLLKPLPAFAGARGLSYFLEGLPGEEVAKMLGMSDANVRVQLHRARRQIVDWVQARLGGKA